MTIEDQDFVLLGEKDIVGFNTAGLLPQSPDDIKAIQKWLKPTDYSADSSEYNKHLASYSPNTGEWIQETEQCRKWLKSDDHGTLWLKAVAGAGKSVAAAHIASKLTDGNVPVLHFFFRQIITTNKTPQSLVRDWMSQVLEYSPMLQFRLKDLKNRDLESVAFDELWSLLSCALQELPRVYCVADALDEMDMGNEKFMRQLIHLGAIKPASVKVLLTSRPLPPIEAVLNCTNVLQIPLRLNLVEPDIVTYVKNRLLRDNISEDLNLFIQKAVCDKARGLFLYARLMIDDVLEFGNQGFPGLQETIEKLPNGLNEMYNQMLFEHSRRSGVPLQLQLMILQCVTHSSRPLRLLEIATAVKELQETTHGKLLKQSPGKDAKSTVRAACGPLIEILEDETVSIIHHSFTEFLIDQGRKQSHVDNLGVNRFPILESAKSHHALADICIRYLLSDWHESWRIAPFGDRRETPNHLRMNYPFLDYAISYWHYHLSMSGSSDEGIFLALDSLMKPKSKRFLSLLDLMDYDSRPNKISPLHLVASKGLHLYAEHLITNGHDVNQLAPKSQTSLHLAAESGHHQTVMVLLTNGAADDSPDSAGHKPIHLAARKDHHRVVKILLEHGVDAMSPKTRESPGRRCGNAYRSTGDTSVRYACQSGHTDTVKEFIPFLTSNNLNEALCWTAAAGKSESVLAILGSSGMEINKRVHGSTAIYLASGARDLISMKKLLDLGADVSITSNNAYDWHRVGDLRSMERKMTPLHAFAGRPSSLDHVQIPDILKGFGILLDAGCDINMLNGEGESAFHYALRSSHPELIKYLLARGADPLLKTEKGYSPLHLLLGSSDSQAVRVLVGNGADVDAQLPDGRTPLAWAAHSSQDSKFLALLECGADCNKQDNHGDTLLHFALRSSNVSLSTVETLLKNGANPNTPNNHGDTPLHVFSFRSFTSVDKVWQALKAAKANLEAKTRDGLTVLLKSLDSRPCGRELKPLLDAGAMLDARDWSGQTALHLACKVIGLGTRELVAFLLKHGADPGARDYAGNTIFHELAKNEHDIYAKEQLELLKMFHDLGVSPMSCNHAGETPFHIAVRMTPNYWHSKRPMAYQFFLGPNCNTDVNAVDNYGVRPIHLAAARSERQVRFLLADGAKLSPLTFSSQSALHYACIAKQSNIVGLLIEICPKQEKLAFVNQIDKDGRTALHYACRSGRLETVRILLEGGADPNVTTNVQYKMSLSPLDMCLEFKKDVVSPASKEWSESETLGVRRIVQELVRHGADRSFLAPAMLRSPYSGRGSTFAAAVAGDNEVIVDELLQLSKDVKDTEKLKQPRQRFPWDSESDDESDDESEDDSEDESEPRFDYRWGATPWNHFLENRVCLRYKDSASPLGSYMKAGDNNLQLFTALLRTENYQAILELQKLGADFFRPLGSSCISVLVNGGYSALLEQVLRQAASLSPSWLERLKKDDSDGYLNQLLLDACNRTLPNIDVVRVLVENLSLDVNFLSQKRYGYIEDGASSLHILAYCENWWQLQALEYLASNGADLDIRDKKGNTALHAAVVSSAGMATVQVLIRLGANPNILDSSSRSCLNKAKENPELIRLLIANGADISAGSKPFVLDVIKAMDVMTMKMLVELGANFNIRPTQDDDTESDSSCDDLYQSRKRNRKAMRALYNEDDESFPVHFAACLESKPEKRRDMLPIIQLLLRGGANPWLPLNDDGDTILHDICSNNGILEPFLDLPDIDMENRDSNGRTLLLAACSATDGYIEVETWTWKASQTSAVAQLLQKGADISATDDLGRNVLHSILSTKLFDSRANDQTALKPNFELLLSNVGVSDLITRKDLAGSTALHYALRYNKLWAVDALIEKGADPTEPDSNGDTALHYLARQYMHVVDCAYKPNELAISLFSKFCTFGVNIDAPNKFGETPIFNFLAAEWGDMNSFLQLIDAGADVTVKDGRGQGLLHVIGKLQYRISTREGDEYQESSHTKIYKWLMENGLNPMDEDEEQRTSLDFAAASGNEQILRLFKRI